jgi:threonine/homoserine/homoserine lactone efflux protein
LRCVDSLAPGSTWRISPGTTSIIFDYSLIHWTAFFSAAILLNLSAGPDIAFILGQTARGGQRAGFAAMFGIWIGAFGHVIMAAVGL